MSTPRWHCVRGHVQYLAFAPHSSEVSVRVFWSFCTSLSLICPNCTCRFLSPLQLLCILLFKEMFVQVQALQQRVQGPRSQIIACLIVNYPISHFYDLFIITAFIRYFQPPLPQGHVKIYIPGSLWVEPCYWFESISYEQKGHQLLVSQLTEWEIPRALSPSVKVTKPHS